MMLKYAIALAALLILAAAFRWAFLPARHLPGHRARHLRTRLHLRLHPGKGFATIVSLWLRWGRLAALRRSRRIRRSLPLWHRILAPGEHSVFLGRALWRHGLRIPLEEHVLVMAPPRTFKTAFLADVILRYPGPVIATTTKADVYALTSAVRTRRGPVHVFNPQHIGGVASTLPLVAGRRLRRPGHRGPPRGRVRVRRLAKGRRGRHVLVRQGQRLPARLLLCSRPGRL
jgi:type IV secretion system protein VirD4